MRSGTGITFALRFVFVATILLSAAYTRAAVSGEPRNFPDPAPPVAAVIEVGEAGLPSLSIHPKVVLHASPKPLAAGAVTHDWESFLGPTHDGVSTEGPLLMNWPEGGPDLVWEMETGVGYASPAISGDRLVIFHRVEDRDTVECLHPETGERYWDFSYATRYKDRYGYNNGPRCSPVIDDDLVYVCAADGRLHCLHLPTGKMIWKRHLFAEFKVEQDFFGASCTPLIEGDNVILNLGAPKGPCVIALDKKTGGLVWGAGEAWGPSYASPTPATVHGKRRVFVFAGGESSPPTGGLICLDPADGKIDFTFPWRSTSYESVNASCPVVVGNGVFVSASYDTGGAFLDVLPDFTKKVRWTADGFGTHFNTAIEKDGYLYGFDGRHPQTARLVCYEIETGKEVWRVNPTWEETVERRGRTATRRGGTLRGTLLLAGNGKFLSLGEGGDLLWMDLSPEGYREIVRAKLFNAPETWSPMVLSRGLLYISQNYKDLSSGTPSRVLCYDLRGE